MNDMATRCFCLAIGLMFYAGICQAGELFVWTDKHGKQHITDTEPPPSAKKITDRVTFRRTSAYEVRAWQDSENRSLSRRVEADQRRSEQIQAVAARDEQKRSVQDSRDKRADQLRAVVGAVAGSGALGSYRETIETMARNKEEQIRAGTDRPMSQAEDMRFHMRQEIDQRIREDRIINGRR